MGPSVGRAVTMEARYPTGARQRKHIQLATVIAAASRRTSTADRALFQQASIWRIIHSTVASPTFKVTEAHHRAAFLSSVRMTHGV